MDSIPRVNKINVIGVDGGGIENLSKPLQELIFSSERLAAPNRILKALPDSWSKLFNNLPLPKLFETNKPVELISWIKEEDSRTVVIASGDPLWFGIGRYLTESFSNQELNFYPSPTSMQLAFAKLGRSWQDASWISLHGRDSIYLANQLRKKPKSLVVLADPNSGGAQEILSILYSTGLEFSYQVWLFENLGHPKEKLTRINLSEKFNFRDIDPLHLIILILDNSLPSHNKELPRFGIQDGFFYQYEDRPGLITKREIRIQILADLDLPEKGVLWDLGAGVGSVGLEALRISPNIDLMSIDKSLGSKKLIERNAKLLGVEPAAIIEDEALTLIESNNIPFELSCPDRVLIGGCGAQRAQLLKLILKKINPKGIIVIPLVTLEGIQEIISIFNSLNCKINITQHQSWRGTPLAKGTRLVPMNPVFIIKANL